MLRVFRDSDGEWWLDRHGLAVSPARWQNGPDRAANLDELEGEIADRLAKLLFVEPGGALPNVGKRVDSDTFWLYSEEQQK
jgi:hypothetical protein